MGVSHNQRYLFGGPYSNDYGSIFGSPILGNCHFNHRDIRASLVVLRHMLTATEQARWGRLAFGGLGSFSVSRH